jgi:AraC-like DNA-binding protein
MRVSIHWDGTTFQPAARHDAILAGFVKLARITYGDTFAPLEVAVDRDRPSCAQRFEEWFRAPIVWATSPPSLLLARDDLVRPLATGNASVAVATERLAAEYLARLDREDIRAQVRRHLLGLLPSGVPSQRETARALGLSSRTLHRRLAEVGTSFGDLLDEMRRELAHDYLRRSDYAVSEVAYLLGFAETSSFNRAFKRWTGQAPSAFRGAPVGAVAGANAD